MHPLQKRDSNSSNCTPPPELRAGQKKNLHSPWSAPRTRKRANVVTVKAEPAPLAIIQEDYSSPPKRRNEGTSPAARELRLSAAGLALDVAAVEDAGPLEQGLLRQPSGDGFSPLGSCFARSSFSSGVSFNISAVAGGLALQAGDVCAQRDSTAAAAAAAVGAAAQPLGDGSVSEAAPAAAPLRLAECSYGLLERSWTAPVVPSAALVGLSCGPPDHPRPMSAQTALTDRSRRSHGEMECDMRSSWGSERSADEKPWWDMQARLHEEFALVQSARRSSGGGGQQDGMRASAESLRDSLEMPSCTERQASMVPLRTSMKGHWQQSHLPSSSPVTEGRAQHKLPSSNMQSPAFQRLLGSGQKHKGMCFCPSPFCKPPREMEEDAEVVRRTESEEFVLYRTQSFNAGSRERPGTKPRRESLNRPPSPGEQELVHRQDAFSAKCCSTPVHLLSPQSACTDEGASPCYSPDMQELSSQDLFACLRDQSKNPTIDELNDLLRNFCTLDLHPKDAEELVSEACKSCELAPNATTLRTLDKIWAAHEQMYG